MSTNPRTLIILAAIVLSGLALSYWLKSSPDDTSTVSVQVPSSFSTQAAAGQVLFEANCMVCHGKNGAGTKKGPPLIHILYVPSHHGDISFQRAAKNGVRAHHWRFGNMPPVAGVTPGDVSKIIAFVRQVQRANGIK